MLLGKRELVNRSYSDPISGEDRVFPGLKKVRNAYGFDGADHDPGLDCQFHVTESGELIETPSLTRQSDADDCDINVMMARYQATGEPPRVNPREPQWGDFSSVPDYQKSLAIVQQAQEDFALLDADVRARFGNDPSQMLSFLSDEANREEAMELGLVIRPPDPPPVQKVEIVNPPEPRGRKAAAAAVDGD